MYWCDIFNGSAEKKVKQFQNIKTTTTEYQIKSLKTQKIVEEQNVDLIMQCGEFCVCSQGGLCHGESCYHGYRHQVNNKIYEIYIMQICRSCF